MSAARAKSKPLHIPGIWKPGTSSPAPPQQARHNKSNNPTTPKGSATTTTDDTSATTASDVGAGKLKKQKLSGATMNMRFMQRKQPPKSVEKRREEDLATRQREMHAWRDDHGITHTDADDANMGDATTDDTTTTTTITKTTPQHPPVATDADMYGVSAALVGRRSFGGFHRAVEDTWDAAYRTATATNNSTTTTNVSDDELLRRYKQYRVHGEDGTHAAPIGNLSAKKNKQHKKKNNNNANNNNHHKRNRNSP